MKQKNVNLLIETNNIQKLEQIAGVLGVNFMELFNETQPQEELNGFIEYKGKIFKITSIEDMERVLHKIYGQ